METPLTPAADTHAGDVLPPIPELTEEQKRKILWDFLRLAVSDVCEVLPDLTMVVLQGPTPQNEAKRGGIILGLERAIAHIKGEKPEFKVLPGFR